MKDYVQLELLVWEIVADYDFIPVMFIEIYQDVWNSGNLLYD